MKNVNKWERNAAQKYAEKYWTDNGYQFTATKEYSSKVVYMVGKDGIEMQYEVSSNITDPKGDMKLFEKSYAMFCILKQKGRL